MVVPWPSSDEAVIVPPWASTSDRAMGRPSPLPAALAGAVEAVEDSRQHIAGDSRTGVLHLDHDPRRPP